MNNDTTGDAVEVEVEEKEYIIEESERLSKSVLWKIQRDFFQHQGIGAWRDGFVPYYITSNPLIAYAYAKMVFGFLRDCYAVTEEDNSSFGPINREQPVYIVELGSGSGQFAYHFIKSLLKIVNSSPLKGVRIKYIMTDLVERNLEYWSEHPAFQPFLELGVLDFARFDAVNDTSIKLRVSGNTISSDEVANPMVFLANYFFDAIPQDSFYVSEGKLHESLVTVSSSKENPNLSDPELLSEMKVSYDHKPIEGSYYDDEDLNKILLDYEQWLGETALLFPCTALKCIKTLHEISSGRLLLISGDKGYSREEDVIEWGEPQLALHGGSFSFMVNFHALGQYFRNHYGEMLDTSFRSASLNICAFLMGNHPNGCIETKFAFQDSVEKLNPDDLFLLMSNLEKNSAELTLDEILACIRLAGWDAWVFWRCFDRLGEQSRSAPDYMKQELYYTLQQIWDNYYSIGDNWDLPFHIGVLLYNMSYYSDAIKYFQLSLDKYGQDAMTQYNIGLCHYYLGSVETSVKYVNKALELNPKYDAAKAMRIKIQSQLRRTKALKD